MRTPQPQTYRCFCALAIAAGATAALLTVSAGCNKKGENDGPRPAPIGPSAPTTTRPAAAAPGPGPVQAENLPPPTPTPGAAAPTPGGKAGGTIVGKVTLADARKGNVLPNDAVYLVARRVADNPGVRGSLVAVKRLTANSFPIDFTLSAADMMFQNGAFEGDLTLSARIDKDGDPMTRRKGDVFGTVERVKVGATGVEVKLDTLQAEDESLAAPPMRGNMPSGHP